MNMNIGNVKKLSSEPSIGKDVHLTNAQLGPWTEVGDYTHLENVVLDAFSYCGQFCFMQNTRVGKFSNIAAAVRLGPTMHPLDRPTLHHFTYRRVMFGLDETDDVEFFRERTSRITTIGHDTWLGHGVIVMPGLAVGHGAVIGSGAVVTKDVAPWTIVGGVPAKFIRRRFTPELGAALEAIAWWDWPYELIKERFQDFLESAAGFAEKYDPRQSYRSPDVAPDRSRKSPS
jgi:phosphonate metabolism protein (transferase hexapeptide repeat family)